MIINVHKARLCARCAIFLSEIKQFPFSCRLAKEFTILKRIQNQFKVLLEMCIFLASIVPTERNANPLLQLRHPFMVLESVEPGCLFTKFFFCYKSTWKRQKQAKHAFSLLKKVNLVPNKQLLVNAPFQSTKYGQKNLFGQQSTRDYWRCVLSNM